MDFNTIFFYAIGISNVLLSLGIDSAFTKVVLHLKQKSGSGIEKDDLFQGQTSESTLTLMPQEDGDSKSTTPYHQDTCLASTETDSVETTTEVDATTIANIKTTIRLPRDHVSCICGIFLGSQFVKGSSKPPKGDPVLSTTIERSFPCHPIGQKQCQTKCLQQIIQHLPNSANILCATLDHDILREKAFLFVRNCSSKWHNTNLAAGREYCCKNGLPYNCPRK